MYVFVSWCTHLSTAWSTHFGSRLWMRSSEGMLLGVTQHWRPHACMYYYVCTPYTANYVAAIYNIIATYIHRSYDNLQEVASEFIDIWWSAPHAEYQKVKSLYSFKHGDYKAWLCLVAYHTLCSNLCLICYQIKASSSFECQCTYYDCVSVSML